MIQHLEFQQEIVDALPLPIFYVDQGMTIIGCNTAFETVAGFPSMIFSASRCSTRFRPNSPAVSRPRASP